MPSVHADFGPSSSKRNLSCPGSFLASRALGAQGRTSKYAAEGTAAHWLAEDCIINDQSPHDRLGEEIEADGMTFAVDEDMADAVQVYVDLVTDMKADAAWVKLETQVDLAPLWAPGQPPVTVFGTSDALAYRASDRTLVVCDYKHGRGVPVEVHENTQLMMYGLGALLKYQGAHRIDFVELVVCQPRAPHREGPVRRSRTTALDLVMWANDVLLPGVDACMDPDAPLAAGDWCKFCPARASCPELQQTAQDAARLDFAEDVQTTQGRAFQAITGDELAAILNKRALIETWLSAVEEEAARRVEADPSAVPGWKLVPKRASRKWGVDEDHVRDAVPADVDPYTHKLKSPAQIEKALGKKRFADLGLADLAVTQSSGTTLAPDTDARPCVGRPTASADFS